MSFVYYITIEITRQRPIFTGILFSADYPYSSMAEARRLLEELPVSPADRERIAHGNAERSLKL